MANSKIGTSTTNTLGGKYHVFLSFRGPDTRRGFTNSLYHALVDAGIHVFIDDEELRSGERISDSLLQAINNSKIYIPIFSKNYASSHWCLSELTKMVENTSTSKEDGKKKAILPIFYDAKPDDVTLKTALYSKAIMNLEKKMEDQKKKFSSEDVEMWQQALKEVDGTKGWELEKYSGHGDLIKSVVNEIIVRLKTRQRQVTVDLVGMEDRMATVNNLLDIDSTGVRLIGIYGMGGIGKTTLAKIIFNQLCPCFGKNCSFLDDIREMAKTKGSLVELQRKLLSDISNSGVAPHIDNMDQGITMIGQTICNKKMLIVLDDVDEGNQILKLIEVNSLCSGTRILVTTRDKSILKIRGFKYKILHYEMEELSKKDALQLFSRHSFDDSSPPTNYYTLSKGIVSTTGGLPLALEAIGSLLFSQKEETIWEETLEKLRETPHRDVLGKLKISYVALEPDQQHIFLDVACFFIGWKKTNLIYQWKYCGFKVEYAIQVLINRCMIKFLEDDEIWMHDQFRDLGRAIAIQEHTRLWDKDDIICKLRSIEIKESVQALCLRSTSSNPTTITAEQLRRFPHLKFLWLSNVVCQGDFTGYLAKLKWIIFWGAKSYYGKLDSLTNFGLESVVLINICFSRLNEDEISYVIKGATKLKILTLEYNNFIHGTPTFRKYLVLEKLTIYHCPSLKKIDRSIGKLRWLTNLSIELCLKLEKLPEQIGELKNLQHLSLSKCDSLSELPDSISKLELLTKLDISRTRITRLPNSIGRLRSLSFANVLNTPIVEMPSTMSKLLHLQLLNLEHGHSIKEWPELPRSLTTLRLISTSLLTVPNLSNLTNLVELFLSDDCDDRLCKSSVIPTGELRWIGRLSKLSKLHFCLLNVRAPTTELGSLSLLKELTLSGLDFRTLKQLPPNLIVLKIDHTRVKHVHLSGLPPLEKSRENEVYGQLDGQSLDVFDSLDEPSLHDILCVKSRRFVPEDPGYNELQAPELIEPWRGNFLVLSSLKMLREFHMGRCRKVEVIDFVSPLESLEAFTVEFCCSLRRIKGLSNLKKLKRLHIESCWRLLSMEGIHELEFLRLLRVHGNIYFKGIFDASSSKIPNECQTDMTSNCNLSGKCDTYHGNWESFREKIRNDEEEIAGRLN